MKNVVDRLGFLSVTRCDTFTELEFIASHFCDFLPRPAALRALPFSMIYDIASHGPLKLDSEDILCDFVSQGIKMSREVFSLLEFSRLGYCSANVMNDFFNMLSSICANSTR
jgi:hypothetical protein